MLDKTKRVMSESVPLYAGYGEAPYHYRFCEQARTCVTSNAVVVLTQSGS
jgi:hypothetical protein